METTIEFGLLGPLEVRCGGTEVTIATGKQRAVLAILALNAGRVVAIDELIDALWGPAPPPSARVTLQNYVMRLRNALGEAGRQRISTRHPGYLMSLDAGELDVTRFEALVGEARSAAGDASWEAAAARGAAALALWRGDPLSDAGSAELVRREVPRLNELRLQALEIRIDADLHAGRHRVVIAELGSLVVQHPLRESLHALRMLALYRDGRQAEALAAYQRARRTLVRELGTEPGAELARLHQRMLRGDPSLALPPADTGPGTSPPAAGAPPASPDPEERDFIAASDQARRRVRRRRGVTALVSLLIVGFAAEAASALHASQVATSQRDTAIASQLMINSQGLGDSDPVLSRLESLAAFRIDPSPQARDVMLTAAALPGIAVLDGKGGPVTATAFSPDRATLAVGSGSDSSIGPGEVTLWNMATRRETRVIRTGDGGAVTALAISRDGTTLAVGTRNGTVSLFDVASGRPLGVPLATGSAAGNATIIAVAFGRHGTTLAAARSDGLVRRWDVATGREAGAFRTSPAMTGGGAPSPDYSAAFAADGEMLAVGGSGTVTLWNVATRHETGFLLRGAGDGVASLTFSSDSQTLAVGGYEGAVRLFDTATGDQVGSPLAGGNGAIGAVAFSPGDTTLATGGPDGTVRLWTVPRRSAVPRGLAGQAGTAALAALSPDGKLLAIGTTAGTVRLFGTATWRQAGATLATGRPDAISLAFGPRAATLAVVSGRGAADPVVQVFSLGTHGVATIDTAAEGEIAASVALSPDGTRLAVAGATPGGQGVARLFDVATGQQVGAPLTAGAPYAGAAFSPDGGTLAVAGADGAIRLWDIATGRQTGMTLSAGPVAAGSMAFSPDGKTLAVATRNARFGKVRVFDSRSGTVRLLDVATGIVQLFDVATGQRIGTPLTVGAPVFSLSFSPAGTTLSATAPDGTITRWDVSYTVDPVAAVCRAAARPLTHGEWARYVPGLPYRKLCPG